MNANPSLTVEGIARVVRIDGEIAWLEPEQTTSCGSCASSAACGGGAPGVGTVASRLAVRRFQLDNPPGLMSLHEGERIVVGVSRRALLKAAATAYGLPLATAIAGGAMAEATYGSDGASILGMLAGLAAGLLAARLGAAYLNARGELSPRFLRRALPGETCETAKD